MEFSEHWFDLVQTIGIIGGLLATAYTIRRDERARRVGNSIAINGQYQEIQRALIHHPQLKRIFDPKADVRKEPVSIEEEAFVKMIIGQLSTVYRAMQHGEFVTLQGLKKDVQGMFSLPIAKAVWDKFETVQDRNFALLVKECLRSGSSLRE
jgi:hypothetical protein